MVRKLFFCLLMLLLLVNIASATETEITIKTLPRHEVQLTILDSSSDEFSVLDRLINESDGYGDASFVYSSDEPSFDLAVLVKLGTRTIEYEKFREDYPAGEPISLEVVPAGYEVIETPEVPELKNATGTSTNTTKTKENATEESPKITGSIFGEGGFFSRKIIYYIIGGAILILIAGFLTARRIGKNKLKSAKPVEASKPTKPEEKEQEKKEAPIDNKLILEDAERKIKEAQEEIRRLRNEERITEAKKKLIEDKKRIIEDQRELMRLRGGRHSSNNPSFNPNPNKNLNPNPDRKFNSGFNKNPDKNPDKKFSF